MVAYLCAALLAWYALLYTRIAPRRLMQCWFVIVNASLIFPAALVTPIVFPLVNLGVPRRAVTFICVLPLCIAFRMVWWLNPQIRMTIKFDANVDGKPTSWYDLPLRNCAIVSNHTSFWDVYAFLVSFPLSGLFSVRTLMKASLLKIPLLGPALLRVGHFPVYFKSDEEGNFQVDKERQALVQQDVNRHIKEGGRIAIFPEGAVNKSPAKLQTFRFGTFQTIFDHRLPTYYAVVVGNNETWPCGSMVGGLPGDIFARVGYYPINFDTKDAKEVAVQMRDKMQKVYDEILEDIANYRAGKPLVGYKGPLGRSP